MIPRHEHTYPREDRIRLVSSVTCGELSVRAPTEEKRCPLYVHYTPGFFPTPRWSPFDWPRWRCCPRCHTGVSERRSRLRSPARGLSLAASSRSHLSLHTRQTIALQTLNVLTNPQPEVVEGVLVDDVKLPHQRKSELHHRADVHVLPVMFLRDVQKRATSQPCVQRVINCAVVRNERGGFTVQIPDEKCLITCAWRHKHTPEPQRKNYLSAVWPGGHVETCCSHVGAANGLNLLHPAEFGLGKQLRTHQTNSAHVKRLDVELHRVQFQDLNIWM